jgi:hypothetical protein
LLLTALAAAFSAQSRVAQELARMDDRSTPSDLTRSVAGSIAPWLIVAGLATVAIGHAVFLVFHCGDALQPVARPV